MLIFIPQPSDIEGSSTHQRSLDRIAVQKNLEIYV